MNFDPSIAYEQLHTAYTAFDRARDKAEAKRPLQGAFDASELVVNNLVQRDPTTSRQPEVRQLRVLVALAQGTIRQHEPRTVY
jgi:hypothetical protein